MIIEGRTIKTIEEMLEFCEAVIAADRRQTPWPSGCTSPLYMQLAEITLSDGSNAYDVLTSPAA